MKIPIVLILLLSCFSAIAKVKIPKSVFSVDKIEEAQDEAKKRSRPITFIYSSSGSN